MAEIKIKCDSCRGTGKAAKNKQLGGFPGCFWCKGKGYTTQEVDEDAYYAWELKQMSKSQLALTDHDKYRWQCSVEGCLRYTVIRDYGIAPWYHTRWGWLDLSVHVMLCHPHGKQENAGQALQYKYGAGDKHLCVF